MQQAIQGEYQRLMLFRCSSVPIGNTRQYQVNIRPFIGHSRQQSRHHEFVLPRMAQSKIQICLRNLGDRTAGLEKLHYFSLKKLNQGKKNFLSALEASINGWRV